MYLEYQCQCKQFLLDVAHTDKPDTGVQPSFKDAYINSRTVILNLLANCAPRFKYCKIYIMWKKNTLAFKESKL